MTVTSKTIYVCDRCKAQENSEANDWARLVLSYPSFGPPKIGAKAFDLCRSCSEAFNRFWDEAPADSAPA